MTPTSHKMTNMQAFFVFLIFYRKSFFFLLKRWGLGGSRNNRRTYDYILIHVCSSWSYQTPQSQYVNTSRTNRQKHCYLFQAFYKCFQKAIDCARRILVAKEPLRKLAWIKALLCIMSFVSGLECTFKLLAHVQEGIKSVPVCCKS